jgi:hypothetical protein
MEPLRRCLVERRFCHRLDSGAPEGEFRELAGMQGCETGQRRNGRQAGEGPRVGGIFEGVLVIAGPQTGGGGDGVLAGGGVGSGGFREIATTTGAVRRLGGEGICLFTDWALVQVGGEGAGHGGQSSR